MGSISTSINLNDGLTSVVHEMYKSLNYLTEAFESTSKMMDSAFDNSALEEAKGSMARAVASAGMLENALREAGGVAETVKKSFEWQSIAMPQTFDTTGIERAKQEFSALESSAKRVMETQDKLAQSISGMKMLPPNALQEINSVNSRIANIRTTITRLQ